MATRTPCLPRRLLARAFWGLAALLVGGVLARGTAAGQRLPAPKYSQGQVAGLFLRAVLRAEYVAAYSRLAPEVRRAVSPTTFETAARPLCKAGHHAAPLELYKLGVRLGDGGASLLFYSFAFAADSALQQPSVLFEVTFRDTAARGILGFGLARVARWRVPKAGEGSSPRR